MYALFPVVNGGVLCVQRKLRIRVRFRDMDMV